MRLPEYLNKVADTGIDEDLITAFYTDVLDCYEAEMPPEEATNYLESLDETLCGGFPE